MLITKEYKSQCVDWCVEWLKMINLSDKTIACIMRSFHIGLPFNTTAVLLLGSQTYALLTLLMLVTAFICFGIFGGCMLTSIEYKLDGIDFTIMDLVIELLRMDVCAKTRVTVSWVIAGLYILFAFGIYYLRFGTFKLQNNIYDDMNIFKNFYQHPNPKPTTIPSSNERIPHG